MESIGTGILVTLIVSTLANILFMMFTAYKTIQCSEISKEESRLDRERDMTLARLGKVWEGYLNEVRNMAKDVASCANTKDPGFQIEDLDRRVKDLETLSSDETHQQFLMELRQQLIGLRQKHEGMEENLAQFIEIDTQERASTQNIIDKITLDVRNGMAMLEKTLIQSKDSQEHLSDRIKDLYRLFKGAASGKISPEDTIKHIVDQQILPEDRKE